jgi:tRNA pseudouridine13 synthase
VKRFSEPIRKLYFSAYQSYLFNHILDRRLEVSDNAPGKLFAGDLAWIHRNGAVFRIEDATGEQARADAFEISPSGPIFGMKMIQPQGIEARIEEDLLAKEGLLPATFHQLMPGLHMEGGRRPFRVSVRELRHHLEGEDLCLEFFLPKGSYATTFLREIMKREEAPPGYGGPDEPDERPEPAPPPDTTVPAEEEVDLEAEDELTLES